MRTIGVKGVNVFPFNSESPQHLGEFKCALGTRKMKGRDGVTTLRVDRCTNEYVKKFGRPLYPRFLYVYSSTFISTEISHKWNLCRGAGGWKETTRNLRHRVRPTPFLRKT